MKSVKFLIMLNYQSMIVSSNHSLRKFMKCSTMRNYQSLIIEKVKLMKSIALFVVNFLNLRCRAIMRRILSAFHMNRK